MEEVFDNFEIEEITSPTLSRKRKFEVPDKGNDNSKTPDFLLKYVFQRFPVDFDPCPLEPEEDGLKNQWGTFSFVHPPSSETQVWVEKAAAEASHGRFSVLFIPASFNSIYWREVIIPNATRVILLTCPIKFDGQKKQIVTQMCLVVFAAPLGNGRGHPEIEFAEPLAWEEAYYKRPRNRARFSLRKD